MHLATTLRAGLSRIAKRTLPISSQLSRARASDTIRIPLDLAVGLLCGSTLAYLAWTVLPTPGLAALLPLALAVCRSRAQACSIGFAYVATVLRFNPTEIFSSNSSLSIGATAVLGGVVWSLAWTANISPYRKALANVLAWGTALLPPVGLLVPGHPVLAWGHLAPHTAWLGVVLSAAVPAGTIFWMSRPQQRFAQTLLVATFAVYVGFLANNPTPLERRILNDMVAVSTRWPLEADPAKVQQRLANMANTVQTLAHEGQIRVVIYPTLHVSTGSAETIDLLKQKVLVTMESAGQTLVLGDSGSAQVDGPTATAYGPCGKRETAYALLTDSWRSWIENPWRVLSVPGHNKIDLGGGIQARIRFGHEELYAFLYLVDEVRGGHQIQLVLQQSWSLVESGLQETSQRHSAAMALLFHRKSLRAGNRLD